MTTEQLSRRIHLSPSAISRRVQRLIADGSIAGQIALIGEKLRSRRVNAIVTIQLDRHHPREADEFRRALASLAEVQLLVEITGTSDVLLLVTCRDMDRFNAFADELARQPLVRRYETSFIKRTVKFTPAVPLDD